MTAANEEAIAAAVSDSKLPVAQPEDVAELKSVLRRLQIEQGAVFTAEHVQAILQRTAAFALQRDALPLVKGDSTYLGVLASSLAARRSSGSDMAELRSKLTEVACDVLYAAIRPERYDLFNHMSACEMFFVDGDSLLLHALSNVHANWQLCQSVHVVYVAMQLLHNLASRGGKFQVIFFESNEWVWSRAPQKRLLRAVLRLALKQRASEVKAPFAFYEFPDWWGEPFRKHVATFEPEFMLLSDGEQITADPLLLVESTDQSGAAPAAEDAAAAAAWGERAVRMLHAALATILSLRVHVAYTTRLVYKDNAIIAFVARSFSSRFQFCDALTRDVGGVAVLLAAGAAPVKAISEADGAAAEQLLDDEVAINMRETAVFFGLRLYMERRGDAATAADAGLAKVLIVATLAARALDISTRAQPRGDSAELAAFLSGVAADMARVVTHFLPDIDFDTSLIDAIDGNLVFSVALLLHPDGGAATLGDLLGDHDLAADADAAWAFVCNRPSATLAGEPLALPPLRKPEPPLAHPGVPVEPTHPLLDYLTAALRCEPPQNPTAHRGYGAARSLQTIHWHMKVALADMDEPPKEEELPAAELNAMTTRERVKHQKKKQRLGTQYLNAIMDTAQSMEGVAFLFANETQCIVEDRPDGSGGGAAGKKGGAAAVADHARKQRERNAKKGLLSTKERQRRENTIRRANQAMTSAHRTLRELLASRAAVETLEKFVKTLNIAKGRSGLAAEDAPAAAAAAGTTSGGRTGSSAAAAGASSSSSDDDDEAPNNNNNNNEPHAPVVLSPMRQLFQQYIGARNEEDVVFEMDKANRFVGLDRIEKFVDEQFAKKNPLVPDNSFETKSKLQLHFIKCFENHLRLLVLLYKVEAREATWKVEKNRAFTAEAQLKLRKWKDDEEREQAVAAAAPVLNSAVVLFRACQECYTLLERTNVRMTDAQRNKLRAAMRALDFNEEYYRLVDRLGERFEDPTGKLLIKAGQLPKEMLPTQKVIKETATRFQMNHMGHLMDRHVCPTPDNRVPFNPDDWQRELLDIVDRRGSAVVCAPTSAGKTFISYYCMKDVLRTSNEDVVVYVAPSRALVNQAVADVYCRFGKKEYREQGLSVFGVLGGRDFARSPFKCQVLVTVPEALETILMSPLHQKWCQRIRYVIFDEIHSIDNFGNGAVWERLLMMVRAPFVALSATLGATGELCEWLNRVKRVQEAQWRRDNPSRALDQEYKVHMVPFGSQKIQRWSDIEKYAFLPTQPERSQLRQSGPLEHVGLLHPPRVSDIVPLHPLSCVTLEMLRTKFPPDLTLVPKESIQLFDLMARLSANVRTQHGALGPVAEVLRKLDALNPEHFFAGERQITQRRSREYEAELRSLLMQWGKMTLARFWRSVGDLEPAVRKAVRTDFEIMVRALLGSASHAVEQGEAEIIAKAEAAAAAAAAAAHAEVTHHFPDTFNFVKDSMLPALHQLKARGMLPAIVFNFEQDQCMALAERVVSLLEEAEARYRKTEDFVKYETMMKAKQEIQAMSLETKESQKKAPRLTEGEDGKKQERERDEITIDEANYNIPDVLPAFSFASSIAVLDAAQLEEIEEQLSHSPLLKRAIQRGVGIHHAGISGKLRGYVEKLFRMKHLPVVFATETLALGIHSPCRTVVLAGDHVLLNVMQFRQMAGRAGRRGMDFLGHVIFAGVSSRKIRRLLTSDLMVLKGHVQLDATTQLRLLQLHDFVPPERRGGEGIDFNRTARDVSECLATEPLFKLGRDVMNVTTREQEEDEDAPVPRCNYEAFQVYHFRRLLTYYFQQGLHFHDGTSSLGSIASRALDTYNDVRTQNAAIIFAALLSSHALHEVKSPRELQEVLAYVFSLNHVLNVPLEVHPSARHDPHLERNPRAHSVLLPPLQERFPAVAAKLSAVNRVVMTLMTELAVQRSATLNELLGVDRQLPIPFMVEGKDGKERKRAIFPKTPDPELPLAAALAASAIKFTARSPFVAVSGAGDHFEFAEDLQQSLRTHLLLDGAHLPTLDFGDLHSHDRRPFVINAAVMDFERFESQQRDGGEYHRIDLDRYNGLTPSTSFAALSMFAQVMKNLDEAFEDIGPPLIDAEAKDKEGKTVENSPDPVVRHVRAVATRWDALLEVQLKNRRQRGPTKNDAGRTRLATEHVAEPSS